MVNVIHLPYVTREMFNIVPYGLWLFLFILHSQIIHLKCDQSNIYKYVIHFQRLEDEEAKRQRIEALKEKRRQEKMAKIIKERERQRYIENQRKAQDFYRRLLLKRIGMEGFRRLLQRKKDNLRKCEELRRSLYKRTYFQAWFSIYRILKARRVQKADELYDRILKRKYIHLWQYYSEQERSKYNVAVDYHELKLSETTFSKWLGYSKRMKMIEETKMKQATLHHEW